MTHAQSTSNILMVRPATFRKNEETAGNNHYQRDADVDNVHEAALQEFDGMVEDLRSRGVQVMVVEDDPTTCLLYTSPSPRDYAASRMPSSA